MSARGAPMAGMDGATGNRGGKFCRYGDGHWEVIPKQGKCRVAIRIFKGRTGDFAGRLEKSGSGYFERLVAIQPQNAGRASTI